MSPSCILTETLSPAACERLIIEDEATESVGEKTIGMSRICATYLLSQLLFPPSLRKTIIASAQVHKVKLS